MIRVLSRYLKNRSKSRRIGALYSALLTCRRFLYWCLYPYGRYIRTPARRFLNGGRPFRQLEIGPGKERIPGFETINIRWQPHVDYVGDVSRGLPFSDNTFDLIYASHVLEHIPWYMVEKVLTDWVRTLKVGGSIEIWVPNGLLIAQTFVDAELGKNDLTVLDGWYKFNELKDPCVWANGRIFSYGDGSGKKSDPNWHLALFSPRLLSSLMLRSGLSDITGLTSSEVRGHDHGWINLGYRGRKL